ncbi:hypothetical protein SISNIDRAFT_492006 [Sistotremastrum niveocremeum HHB9708]|uniref:JmjC domain-containing protein n=1 Tax=Sistotremastrum niveocremeum HHB9708 TaxID=1314777 RepID=A0A164M5H8_9AGAM|nr:hypothetical protein SISNIDRAFT_492006 [Sistotremastrum niveocremeum HHB9708]
MFMEWHAYVKEAMEKMQAWSGDDVMIYPDPQTAAGRTDINTAEVLNSNVNEKQQIPVGVIARSTAITPGHRQPTSQTPTFQAANSSSAQADAVRIVSPAAGRSVPSSAADVTRQASRPPPSVTSGSRAASPTVYSKSPDKTTARLESPEIPYHPWKPVSPPQSASRALTPADTHALIHSHPLSSENLVPHSLSPEFPDPPPRSPNQNAERPTVVNDNQENSDDEGRDNGNITETEASNTSPIPGSKRKRGVTVSSNTANERRPVKLPPLTPLVWKAVHDAQKIAQQKAIGARLNFRPKLPSLVDPPSVNVQKKKMIVHYPKYECHGRLARETGTHHIIFEPLTIEVPYNNSTREMLDYFVEQYKKFGPMRNYIHSVVKDKESGLEELVEGALHICTQTEWKELPREKKLEISAVQHILILDDSPDRPITRLEDYDEALEEYGLDSTRLYEVNDNRYISSRSTSATRMIRRASIQDLKNPAQKLNFLDLPVATVNTQPRCFRDIDDTRYALQYSSFVQPVSGSMSWLIAGSAGVMSEKHLDSNAATTFIHVLFGVKMWFSSRVTAKPKFAYDNEHPMIAFIMKKGDACAQRAGSLHQVLTMETSICAGGWMYNRECFTASLEAMIAEHLHGLQLANSSEPNTTTYLFRIFQYYFEKWTQHDHKTKTWPLTLPSPKQWASLLVMMCSLPKLVPQSRLVEGLPIVWPSSGYLEDRAIVMSRAEGVIVDVEKYSRSSAQHGVCHKEIKSQQRTLSKILSTNPDRQQKDLWAFDDTRFMSSRYFNTEEERKKAGVDEGSEDSDVESLTGSIVSMEIDG